MGQTSYWWQLADPLISAEARVTLIDGYLAATVLVGLILNALFGWWWADPLASLVLVYYGIKEGHRRATARRRTLVNDTELISCAYDTVNVCG
jgi:divalent metal cation (Fe/Co/Zn/Cd) transporter